MNLSALAVSISGAVVLIGSIAGARHDEIPAWEVRVFRVINGMPDGLYKVLWAPMQLGNLVVGPAVGLAIAWVVGSWGVALGVVAATFLKLVVERVVRREVASYLTVRQRPATSQPRAILRGSDVPHEGPSFPSGHVILVAAVSSVLIVALHPAIVWIPFTLAAVVAVARVYVGAHNPLDVLAGFGAGLLVGGVIALFL